MGKEPHELRPSMPGSTNQPSPEPEWRRDLRVAFIGNVDSGKSSLIGTLMKGELDDGRGSARKAIFRHQHEADTGRTSSIATTYLGFREDGKQVYGKRMAHSLSVAEIAKQSQKRIQLIDLAGHEKYLKTTVFGLTGMQPDFAIVVVGANMGIKKMTREHLGIALALDMPVLIALTKIDIAPRNIAKETMQGIRKYLRNAHKLPMVVKTIEQAKTAAEGIPTNRVAPIFPISNVTGDGLENLLHLMSVVQPQAFTFRKICIAKPIAENANTMQKSYENLLQSPFELPVDDTYQVPGVGFVIAGTVVSGTAKTNENLMIGPDHHGHFLPVTVRSIECMHIPLKQAHAGQHAALAIRSLNKKVPINRSTFRKGMVLVGSNMQVQEHVSRVFDARVLILHHQTTITTGYQPVINIRTIRQTAEIISVKGPDGTSTLRTGDRAVIRFQFVSSVEYIPKNAAFIFRDGQAKGVGRVIDVITG